MKLRAVLLTGALSLLLLSGCGSSTANNDIEQLDDITEAELEEALEVLENEVEADDNNVIVSSQERVHVTDFAKNGEYYNISGFYYDYNVHENFDVEYSIRGSIVADIYDLHDNMEGSYQISEIFDTWAKDWKEGNNFALENERNLWQGSSSMTLYFNQNGEVIAIDCFEEAG